MKIKILPWVLVVFWMGLIFYFSHQPATESSELSSGITEAIVDVINIIAPDNDIALNQSGINFIIRKGAHFTKEDFLSLIAGSEGRVLTNAKVAYDMGVNMLIP